MRLQQPKRSRPQLLALGGGVAVAVAVSVAACGGGSSPSSSSPSATTSSPSTAASSPTASPTSATASPMPTSGAAAEAAVKADWVAFINPKTAAARRIMLLENGSSFDPKVLQAQARNPMAAGAAANVTKVTIVSPTQARVTYTVLVNGSPVLKDQTGIAVYQNGVWKVGVASFCGLLKVESGGSTTSLPAQCRSGG